MKIGYIIIYGTNPPIMLKEGKYLLQLIPDTRVGDHFLFKDHIVIRIYGFEGETYKLPKFLTIRILVMEYIK